jgi:hypothetical protein
MKVYECEVTSRIVTFIQIFMEINFLVLTLLIWYRHDYTINSTFIVEREKCVNKSWPKDVPIRSYLQRDISIITLQNQF